MKILIVSHYLLPHVGGIENVVYNQASELSKLGCDVTIITSNISSKTEISIIGKIKIIRVRALNWFENWFGIPYPIFSPELYGIMSRLVRDHDLIQIHGHIYLSSILACLFSKKYHKIFFLTQHNTYIEYKSILLRCLETILDKTIGLYTLQSADKIVVVSNRTRDYVNSIILNPKKIITLYNGIDTSQFYPIKNKDDLKSNFKFLGKFVCLTIRRITFKNGINTFLETAKKFVANKNIIFVLGGTGTDLSKVKKYIMDHKLSNVILTGYIKPELLPLYYRASDLFILPSVKGEGFPLVVLESFASGVPVIATKSGGQEEIIRDSLSGYLVEVNNVKQIFDKVNYLYKNTKILHKMSINCRNIINNGYSWEINVKKLYKLYQKEMTK
jgi:glycosyltransferase involved in cell wall biosynthesis